MPTSTPTRPPITSMVGYRLTAPERRAFEQFAAQKGMTLSSATREAVRAMVAREGAAAQ
jgi:hypothetical protein